MLTAKKNLSELRQLYFKLRDRVFSAGRLGIGYNTESFEKVLKEEFGTEALMTDIRHPRWVFPLALQPVEYFSVYSLSLYCNLQHMCLAIYLVGIHILPPGSSLLRCTKRPTIQSFTSSTTVSIMSLAVVSFFFSNNNLMMKTVYIKWLFLY